MKTTKSKSKKATLNYIMAASIFSVVFGAIFIVLLVFESGNSLLLKIFFGGLAGFSLFLTGSLAGNLGELNSFKDEIISRIPKEIEIPAEGRHEINAKIKIITKRERFKETKLEGIYLVDDSFEDSEKIKDMAGFDSENFKPLLGDKL